MIDAVITAFRIRIRWPVSVTDDTHIVNQVRLIKLNKT